LGALVLLVTEVELDGSDGAGIFIVFSKTTIRVASYDCYRPESTGL